MNLEQRKQLLREYMAIPRVSGYEGEMACRFRDDLSPLADEVRIDKVGNVIATFRGSKPNPPALMVFAHMDTIGYIVTAIDESGFLRVDRMGGVPEKAVLSSAVRVGTEDGRYLPGIVAAKAYHIQTADEKAKAEPLSKMFIDIGAQNRAEVRAAGVEAGCPVAFAPAFYELMNNRICGSCLDDASGLVTMLELAAHMKHNRPRCTVHLAGTVWEEFNARGAMLASRTAPTDMAVCLLGPGANDTPDQKDVGNVELGGGPAVTLFNFHGKGTLNGCVAHKGMFEAMKQAAKAAGVGLQRSAGRGALSDAAYLQLEGAGIPCLDMGCPDRYSHSTLECLSLVDHEATSKLLCAFIDALDTDFSTDRY